MSVREGGVVGRVLRMEANQVGNGAEIAFHRGLDGGVRLQNRSFVLARRQDSEEAPDRVSCTRRTACRRGRISC
jgi:hypothetical protein